MIMDQYSEVTTQGLGSRLINSIKGVAFGLLFFIIALPLLWWNEGRAIKTARALQEGEKTVISVAADRVDPANEEKLVHVTGRATTNETLKDATFGVSANAIKLRRIVQMYQWTEKSSSQKQKKLGGNETTETTYTYEPSWSEKPVDSATFKQRNGHENPPMPFRSAELSAGNVSLGAFRLSSTLISSVTGDSGVDASQAAIPEFLQARAQRIENGLEVGDPASPKVGDLRITFTEAPQQEVSLVARQVQDTFEPYPTRAGRDIELLSMGTLSAESMFTTSERKNSTLTWILRGAGFILMFVGLMLVFRPLATAGDVIPIFGSLLGLGVGVVSGMVALCLSLLVIALAWIAYRPLVGTALLVLACLAIYALVRVRHSKTLKTPAASASQ
jgi:hypothetical protein